MILAQISDLHVCRRGEKLSGRVDTAACLRKAVTRIGQLNPQPDAILITGDMVNDGTEEEYEHLRELLAPLTMPMYVIPGNHDSREGIRSSFGDFAYLPPQGFLQYTIDTFPVRIIALDTVVPGEGGGALDESRLLWLKIRLQEYADKPTLIMLHHPPFSTGIGFMDAIGLNKGAPEFTRLVASHPNVERILCGHVHRAIEARVGNAIAMTCPATCHQIPLELRPNGPEGYTLEPPGFRLHIWNGNQLVTHTAPIMDFPGPYGFGYSG